MFALRILAEMLSNPGVQISIILVVDLVVIKLNGQLLFQHRE